MSHHNPRRAESLLLRFRELSGAVLLFAVILIVPALAQAQDSITLTWSPNSTGGTVTTYEVFRFTAAPTNTTTPYTTADYASVAASSCGTSCTYTDTAVVEGTTYYYQLEACNSAPTPCSAPTPAVSFTVPFQTPNVPATPTITGK